MTVDVNVPGIDAEGLSRWLAVTVPDAGAIAGVRLLAGGRSNLTYRVDAEKGALVLRRPPLGHVLPTAHDMSREFRVISALADSAVPVPRPVALCEDQTVIGAPFYLMEFVDGVIIRSTADAPGATPDQLRALSERLVQVQAAIHDLDLAAVGLTDFGRPEGYLARQLARWQQQWQRSQTRELPAYDALVARLAAGLPESGPGTLVHGDYRVDNALVVLEPRPDLLAVVDWEMATLGDPLADLGLTLTYWSQAEGGAVQADSLAGAELPVGAGITGAAGFLTAGEYAARYGELTGRDVSGLSYYVAFGNFKLAVILEGIHARFLANQTVGEGFGTIGAAVPVLIDRAHRILDEGDL